MQGTSHHATRLRARLGTATFRRRGDDHGAGPLRLPDGTRVIVRPIREEDAEGFARAYTRLSEQCRMWRFLSVAKEISPGLLRYLTSVDQQSHVALVAIDPDSGEILGSARYIRIPGRCPATAELAVEVVDGWQRRGLGRGLVQALGRLAQANGVERLLAIVSNDNVPMQLLMRRTGATAQATGWELEYTIDAKALAPPLAATGSRRQRGVRTTPFQFGKASVGTAQA
jgi:L-amino acid N-acyltransferase YncA